jgi:hypothetical protein
MNESGILRANMHDESRLDPNRAVNSRDGSAAANRCHLCHRQGEIPNNGRDKNERSQGPKKSFRGRQLQGAQLSHILRAIVGKLQIASGDTVEFCAGKTLLIGQVKQFGFHFERCVLRETRLELRGNAGGQIFVHR